MPGGGDTCAPAIVLLDHLTSVRRLVDPHSIFDAADAAGVLCRFPPSPFFAAWWYACARSRLQPRRTAQKQAVQSRMCGAGEDGSVCLPFLRVPL